jgi:hypothetical protein
VQSELKSLIEYLFSSSSKELAQSANGCLGLIMAADLLMILFPFAILILQ